MSKPLSANRLEKEMDPVPPVVLPSAHDKAETEEITRLAYQYWQQRGCPIGTPEEDWFRAEEEIKLRQL
jgi:hypothetical protein